VDKPWVMFAVICAMMGSANTSIAAPLSLAPAAMPAIFTVDARYQSYNVEMAEVVGGNFWKPYDQKSEKKNSAVPEPKSSPSTRTPGGPPLQIGQGEMFQARGPINLANARLRKLAAALGPAYARVSGTWANSAYFHDSDDPPPTTPPKGFTSILSRSEWKGVVDFAQAVDATIMTSFAISPGVRNAAGIWTTDQAQELLTYTKSVGGEIAAVEFFNEPNLPTEEGAPPHYSAMDFARDFAIFRRFIKTEAPGILIAGPGTVGEGDALSISSTNMPSLGTIDIFAATAPSRFDIFSYHSYPAASIRCALIGQGAQTEEEEALSDEWLARPDQIHGFYLRLRDRFELRKPIWITETAGAACGGNPWASTFLDSFRYLDQLGRLAKREVKVIFHNTLASSDYGLLHQDTFMPRPNYWAALLWRKLMGTTVLDAGRSWPGLKLYAHCLPGHPGGVTILAINNSKTRTQSIELPAASDRYTLTSHQLNDTNVELNGKVLELQANDELPALQGKHIPAGYVELSPASITFLAVAKAGNGDCP
jgi:heparanase 1